MKQPRSSHVTLPESLTAIVDDVFEYGSDDLLFTVVQGARADQ